MAPWMPAVVLPFVFLAPYLGGRIVPFGDDLLILNYPLLSLLAHALHAGYPLLWNPYSGGGYDLAPFSALPLYLPSWLLAVLPVPAAIGTTYALDLVIGGLGAYALAACLGVRPAARLVSAIAFPFSGFVLAHLFAGHFLEVGLICWLPASLAGLHWALGATTPGVALRRGLVCGGPWGMLVLANGVSWLVFVGYPIGIVTLVLALRAVDRARRSNTGILIALLPFITALGAAVVTAGLLGAAVLVPLRDVIAQSVRGGPMDYGAVTHTSEPLLGLALAVTPGLFGSEATGTYWLPNSYAYFQEVYCYLGLPILVLALSGILAGRRRRSVLLYATLAALGIVLALGAYTPLYALLYHIVPGLDLARVPARWLLLTTVAVAALAGVGADALLGSAAARPPVPTIKKKASAPRGAALLVPLTPATPLVGVAIVLALAALGVGAAALLPQGGHHGSTIWPALARLLIVALAMAMAVLIVPQLSRPAGALVLGAIVVVDVWSANSMLVRPLDPAPYYRNAAVDATRALSGTGRVWALDRSVPLRLGMLDRQTRDVQDYAPLTRSDYWQFTHPDLTLASVDTGTARALMGRYNGRIAMLLGVSLVIAPRPLHDPTLVLLRRIHVPRWGILKGDWSHPGPHPGPAYVYRVVGTLPFAWPVYTTRTVRGRVPLDAVFAPSFDPRRTALLDGLRSSAAPGSSLLEAWRHSLAPSRRDHTSIGPGVVRLGETENSMALRVMMRQRGALLLDQIYDRGWTAAVDGRPMPLREADYLLTALPLAAGMHTIVLTYAPISDAIGALLSLLGYLLLLGGGLAGGRRWVSARV